MRVRTSAAWHTHLTPYSWGASTPNTTSRSRSYGHRGFSCSSRSGQCSSHPYALTGSWSAGPAGWCGHRYFSSRWSQNGTRVGRISLPQVHHILSASLRYRSPSISAWARTQNGSESRRSAIQTWTSPHSSRPRSSWSGRYSRPTRRRYTRRWRGGSLTGYSSWTALPHGRRRAWWCRRRQRCSRRFPSRSSRNRFARLSGTGSSSVSWWAISAGITRRSDTSLRRVSQWGTLRCYHGSYPRGL